MFRCPMNHHKLSQLPSGVVQTARTSGLLRRIKSMPARTLRIGTASAKRFFRRQRLKQHLAFNHCAIKQPGGVSLERIEHSTARSHSGRQRSLKWLVTGDFVNHANGGKSSPTRALRIPPWASALKSSCSHFSFASPATVAATCMSQGSLLGPKGRASNHLLLSRFVEIA